jgi:hypothetical protein
MNFHPTSIANWLPNLSDSLINRIRTRQLGREGRQRPAVTPTPAARRTSRLSAQPERSSMSGMTEAESPKFDIADLIDTFRGAHSVVLARPAPGG